MRNFLAGGMHIRLEDEDPPLAAPRVLVVDLSNRVLTVLTDRRLIHRGDLTFPVPSMTRAQEHDFLVEDLAAVCLEWSRQAVDMPPELCPAHERVKEICDQAMQDWDIAGYWYEGAHHAR